MWRGKLAAPGLLKRGPSAVLGKSTAIDVVCVVLVRGGCVFSHKLSCLQAEMGKTSNTNNLETRDGANDRWDGAR